MSSDVNGIHVIKRNDTLPTFRVENMQWGDGTDLSFDAGDTAVFNMHSLTGNQKISGGAVVLDVGQNSCSYAWQSGDTDTSGEFHAEVEVTFASGGKATWPNEGNYLVVITPDLDGM